MTFLKTLLAMSQTPKQEVVGSDSGGAEIGPIATKAENENGPVLTVRREKALLQLCYSYALPLDDSKI